MKFIVVAVLLVVALQLVQTERVFIETDEPRPIPKGWRMLPDELVVSLADEEETRPVIFLLKQRNLEKLEKLFWEVSTPYTDRYGKYLSVHEVADLVSPSPITIKVVKDFLASYGITNTRTVITKDFIEADIPIRIIKQMFEVEFHLFEHKDGQRFYGTMGPYSLPAHVAKHIRIVSYVVGLPTVYSPNVQFNKAGFSTASSEIIPSVIRARYNCSDVIATQSTNSHAVAEFQGQSYSPSDLETFFTKYVTNSKEDTVAQVIGNNDPSKPGIEASLDIQYIMGVAPNVTTWFYGMKQFDFYTDLTRWLQELSNETNPPFLHTVSYGSQGDYPSVAYMQSSDTEYQKLGVQGLTIIFASGDSGAECEDRCTVLYPSYPAVSVYVTAVGATRFLSGNTGPEGSVLAFKSGGGFMDGTYPTLPSYQTTAVNTYMKQDIPFPPTNIFNPGMRANPDFGALGAEEFQVIVDGRVEVVGGTSASAPSFGAVVTMLNDIRLSNGQPTLGFLNTLFYQLAESNPGQAFFDVTSGNNKNGCVSGNCGANYIDGYMCAPGWDPVTGYGTPNYAVLSTLVASQSLFENSQ
jgi:tripeptidyl-peptidase I